VTFCLSKGLSAPVGSVLCGSTEFIQIAHKYRKMLGGGMRQAGVIAAAGIVALNTMIDRLAEDHENARILAHGLAEIPGISIDPEKVQTNLIFLQITSRLGAAGLAARLRERNVLAGGSAASNRMRLVTHYGIERADVERVVREVREILVGVPVGAR
jgi:threonine aldolase